MQLILESVLKIKPKKTLQTQKVVYVLFSNSARGGLGVVKAALVSWLGIRKHCGVFGIELP